MPRPAVPGAALPSLGAAAGADASLGEDRRPSVAFHSLIASATYEYNCLNEAYASLQAENECLRAALSQSGYVAEADSPERCRILPSNGYAADQGAMMGAPLKMTSSNSSDAASPKPGGSSVSLVANYNGSMTFNVSDMSRSRVFNTFGSMSTVNESSALDDASGKVQEVSSSMSRTGSDERGQSSLENNAPTPEKLRSLKYSFAAACQRRGQNNLNGEDLYWMKINSTRKPTRNTHTEHMNQEVIWSYTEAIKAFNRATGKKDDFGATSTVISLDTYVTLIQADEDNVSMLVVREDLGYIISDIRHVLMNNHSVRLIGVEDRSDANSVTSSTLRPARCSIEYIIRKNDAIIGLIILTNAMVVGYSMDHNPHWVVWDYIEIFFTLIFVVEICLKICLFGFFKYFFGPDIWWNWFDCFVVAVAVAEVLMNTFQAVDTDIGLTKLTIMRMLRFLRLTRLLRVVRLKMFKELKLLVNGLMIGFRTLFWASVFLGFFIYMLGVFLRQTIGTEEQQFCLEGQECSESQAHMQRYRHQLFGTVPRAMFTVFRCFTDGCESINGSPLQVHLWDTYGNTAIVMYTLCILFVSFGLFNLIAALFVESTMDNAKKDDDRRRDIGNGRDSEFMRVARKLHEVLCRFYHPDAIEETKAEQLVKSWWHKLHDVFFKAEEPDEPLPRAETLSVKITNKVFAEILKNPEVSDLLTELDISFSSRSSLFDVLDADGNGFLDISELVSGLMKMRGGPEKSDVIAALLAVRSVQKTVKNTELLALKCQKAVESVRGNQERLEEALHTFVPAHMFKPPPRTSECEVFR